MPDFNINDPFGVHYDSKGNYKRGTDPLGLHAPGTGIFGALPEVPDTDELARMQLGYGLRAQGYSAPDQSGLFASTQYQRDPTTGGITGARTALNPEMQALFDSLRADIGTRPGQTSDAIYGQYTSRLDPQFSMREADLETRLMNQGITKGSEAYNREKTLLGQERTDAYGAANRAATVAGGQEQSRLLQNLFGFAPAANAGYQGIPLVATPDLVGAEQSKYNAQVGGRNSQMGGAASLIGGLFSDRRLKSNIVRVGTHRTLGIGIYEYDIFGERHRGVMADEVEKVMPAAVTTTPSGYQMVNYGMIGDG